MCPVLLYFYIYSLSRADRFLLVYMIHAVSCNKLRETVKTVFLYLTLRCCSDSMCRYLTDIRVYVALDVKGV